GPRLHSGAGSWGNGAGRSWLGGQILARLALGVDDELTRLPLVTRRGPKLPPEPFRRRGGGVGGGARRAGWAARESGRARRPRRGAAAARSQRERAPPCRGS